LIRHAAINGIGADPAIDPATVVSDLKAGTLAGQDQVEINVAVNSYQHDIIRAQVGPCDRLQPDDLPVGNAAAHGVSPGPNRGGSPRLQFFDRSIGPAHASRIVAARPLSKKGGQLSSNRAP